MQNRDFQGPPLVRAVASVAGGIITAIALIWILEDTREQFPKTTTYLTPVVIASEPTA